MTVFETPAEASKNGRSGHLLMIRADASVTMGTGHVMRCLALAQAWQDIGGQAVFVLADSTQAIQERLGREGVEVIQIRASPGSLEDAGRLANLAHDHEANWVVVDGYHFGANYQRALKDQNCKILALDDYGHAKHYVADVVLNQNAHANENFYEDRIPQTKLLLGSRYVLLRREFRVWEKWQRMTAAVAKNVLVTLGGSDPENVTSRVLEALDEVAARSLCVVIVGGGSNPHLEFLESQILKAPFHVRLVRNPNMPELMAWADVAIAAAGATCWEMCLLGLPAVLIDLAPNQIPIARSLARLGIAFHAGSASGLALSTIAGKLRSLLGDFEIRNNMSRKGRELVDSLGASRVVAILRGSASPASSRVS